MRGDDSIDLPTREGQHIRQDISVTYNTSQEQAADVFRSFRGADISEIEGTFVRRTIITVAQNQAGQMSLTDLIFQACLGLTIRAPQREVRFARPALPPSLREVHVRDLRVGDATIDLDITRHAEDVGINVTRKVGDVEVIAVK